MTIVGASLAAVAAFTAAALFVLASRQKTSRWVFVAAVVIPILVLLADENWRIHSNHGLLHASIVYEIFERGVPPENPLLAGSALGYPYAHHLLIAELMRVIDVAPPWFFAATNLVCVGLLLWVLDRTAALITRERRYRAAAVLLALLGTNPFSIGVGARLLYVLGIPLARETPPLLKFTTVNSHQIGILLLAVSLYGLVRLFVVREESSATSLFWVALGSLGTGLLYPLGWAPVLGCSLAAIACLGWDGRYRNAVALAAVALLCAVPVMEWILLLNAAKSPLGLPRVDFGADHVARNLSMLVATAALPCLLFVASRRTTTPDIRNPLDAWLLLSSIGLGVTFVVVHLPVHSEHKLLMSAQIPLAFLLARSLAALVSARAVLAAAAVASIIMPCTWFFAEKLASPWTVFDPATTSGRYLVHADPAQRALHDWLITETASDAVLIDRHLALPAFTHRNLLVGINERRASDTKTNSDGVGFSSTRWLRDVYGVDENVLEQRAEWTRSLLGDEPGVDLPELLVLLRSAVPHRPVYAIARSLPARRRLEREELLERVYDGSAAAVFLLR